LYYEFTVNFGGKTIFKICERSAKLQARRLIVSHAFYAIDSVLLKDEEFAIDFTYDTQRLLLLLY